MSKVCRSSGSRGTISAPTPGPVGPGPEYVTHLHLQLAHSLGCTRLLYEGVIIPLAMAMFSLTS